MSFDPEFELLSEDDLSEYRATGRWLRHGKSGAEVYHVHNDDKENLFSFMFKTLPTDSTGVAHILEHTALCGSHRFPVKDPFIQLVRGSLNTFVNAMTYPDKTVYPASSTVAKDLFNLMEVYGDAVFFPLLREEFFRQEGHRVQFRPDDSLELTGIVYNEMKGNYANHDSLVAEWSARSLLPDTPYAYDSGGDPAAIPELTFEEFVAFHRTYYHPSNCRIFLYGDIPTEQYLEFLDREFLAKFDSAGGSFAVEPQTRWSSPREQTVTCPADDDGGPTSISVNWLLDPITDPYRVLSSELLSYTLIGSSASPLRMALIESGLGEDLSASTGIQTELYEMVFSVGLRGTDRDKKEQVEELIFDTLRQVVADGIDPDVVEGALRKVEFRHREIKGGAPNGLRLMARSVRGWLHGQHPEATLRFEQPFSRLRRDAAPGSRYFESLIQKALLENQHRSTVVVVPDAQKRQAEREELDARLSRMKERFSPADQGRIRREQEELERLQATPDSPEALASLPFLSVGDLPDALETIPTQESDLPKGVPCYRHDIFTNGVVYLDLSFDLSGLPNALLPYVPLYASAIGEVGLPGRSYDVVATELTLKTGGFGCFSEAAVPVHEARVADRRLYFRIKTLESTLAEGLDLARDILLHAEFANVGRLGDLVKEARSDMSGAVLPSGHSFAALRAGRVFSHADLYEEKWRGAEQLLFLEANRDAGAYSSALQEINRQVIRSGNLAVNVTAPAAVVEQARPVLERLVHGLPDGGFGNEEEALACETRHRGEALLVPSDVSYVATAMPGSRYGTSEYIHEQVLAHILRTGYLWETIRMKGGAYGANASARGLDGVFGFWSYRDPRIVETVDAFSAGLEHYASGGISDDELQLAIIGVTGHYIRPMSPGQKGIEALRRLLYGITDETRQENYQILLKTTPKDVVQAADRLRQSMAQSVVVVVAGSDAVQAAADRFPDLGVNQLHLPV